MNAIDLLLEASAAQSSLYDSGESSVALVKAELPSAFNGHGQAARLRAPSPSSFQHSSAYHLVHGLPPPHGEVAPDRPNYRRSRAMSEPWSMSEFALSASVLRDCDQTVPDFIAKYSDVINKNGRIGIYTKEERAAIVSRFREKRKRRVWQKKIRYTCRKSLADRRLRIKGRFVKMDPSEMPAELVDAMDGEEEASSSKLRALTSLLGDLDDDEDEERDTEALAAGPGAVEGTHHMVRRPRRPSDGGGEDDDAPYKRMRRHSIAF